LTLPSLFDLSLIGRRASPALEWNGAQFTFGDIDDRASRMANLLAARGLEKGDRLCVYLANCLEYIDLYLAATRLGVIFVPVNVLYRDREIRHILQDAEPKALITTAAQTEFIPNPPTSIWLLEELREEVAAQPVTRRINVTDGDTPAAIVYTSGTTGTSKGAVLTHHNFVVNAVNLLTVWQFSPADKLLLTLPLFHVHGLGNGIHCWLASGCKLRLTERFAHDQAAQWMREFQPTVFFGVPTMYVRMLEWSNETAAEAGANMRLFVSGSAPLPAQTHEEFRAKFGHTILERYGMSETLMNITNPYIGERRPGSVGLPMPGVSVKNADPDGNPVPDGDVGELYLKGPNLFAGYWRREEATIAAHRDGWFRTGDIAVRSPDGYYTLQGRRSDLIISGGFNIYPREIEEFLAEQPGVAEVAVASTPDPRRGEVPVAYIVPGENCDFEAIETACRAHLASFKIPRAFLRIDKLPRTALGKIQKHLLPKWEPGS
jgi:malonyl-CoA/methylmalonyl-CoA synthetase